MALLTAEHASFKDEPYQFAKAFVVDIGFQAEAEKVFVGHQGDWVWRVKVRSPGALSLSLVWGDWWLPEGGEVWIYNEEATVGAFSGHISNKPSRKFATAPLPGDTLTIEYYSPYWLKALPHLRISRIVHGYKPFMAPSTLGGPSGSCEIDVACEAGDWLDQTRAVGVLITQDNQKYCSGALAHHCAGFHDVSNHLVMFNYQVMQCGGSDQELAISYDTVHGLVEIASFSTSDFHLYEIVEPIPDSYNVYMAGWSALQTPTAPIVGIHHPMGDVKKISFYDGNLSQSCWNECPRNMHWRVERWSKGTTEPGSSGSPLFDSTHRIIGQLHGGSASCYNNEGYDMYGALWASFDKGGLAKALDPENTEIRGMDGVDMSVAKKSKGRRPAVKMQERI
ncbi:trypsin-like cysteine/serine peptidase domain-containing protein [Endogone sp. FLAS-F59071]|nr:trypsin-like cysteine/serine peptidase domain-containing protein [Endogone sp. FLAS-F59071]|eukprot:RUS14217.1 trypsin-like cysteine/serine peptidase domain-containing protein [Endogone sp. FLAS-F59071]